LGEGEQRQRKLENREGETEKRAKKKGAQIRLFFCSVYLLFALSALDLSLSLSLREQIQRNSSEIADRERSRA